MIPAPDRRGTGSGCARPRALAGIDVQTETPVALAEPASGAPRVLGRGDDRVRVGDEGLRARRRRAARRVVRDREGRLRLRRRRLRLRQVDDDPPPAQGDRTDARSDPRRRPRPRPAEALEGAAAPPQRRCVFQDFKLLPEQDSGRERRVRAEGAGRPAARRSARRCPRRSSLVGLAHKANSLPTSCRAASNSASRSRAPSSTTRRS